jgi:hypothetical protein
MRFLIHGFLVVAACGSPERIEEDDFPAAAADVFCARFEECAKGEFDRAYFGMGDCEEHTSRDFALVSESFDDLGCSYDEDGAAEAWDHLDSMSCEEFYDGEYVEDYDKVWDCTG